MKRLFGILLALALSSACVPATPSRPACDAEGLHDLIGRNISVLQTMRFGIALRIIGPGTMVTKDFNPDRLNIIHDQTGRITDIACY